jgi:hypothetical protein
MSRTARGSLLAIIFSSTIALMTTLASAASPDAIANLDKSPAQILDVYVFGRSHQTHETQLDDEKTCLSDAKAVSNYDSAMAAASAPSTSRTPQGGIVGGAVSGAVTGTVIGAVAGNAGKGAAIGGTVGALSGAARKQEATRAQTAKAAQERQRATAAAIAELKRAFVACMRARDYSVE